MENRDAKISVIVTIHNAEKYLKECLESVLSQTYSDIEILCIDGGSTDMSYEILKSYATADDRIRIINDTNTSYGHKVNRGIEEARGKYISVLESDDMYETNMLDVLYRVAEKYETDFVNADYTCFFDFNGKRFYYVTKMYKEQDYNHIVQNRTHQEELGIIPRYWTGLFRKDFLDRENIRMNESPGASYQDMSFRFLTSVLADTSYHLDIPVYLYRVDNPGSSMYDSKKTIVIAEEHVYLKNELQKRKITDRYIWHNAFQWKYTDFRGNMRHLRGQYRQELFDRYRQELESDSEILNSYMDLGYSQYVAEMIHDLPENMLEQIECERVEEQEHNRELYAFLESVTNLMENQKMIIFGCGKLGKYILEMLKEFRNQIICLTDNSEKLWNTSIGSLEILSPDQVVQEYPDAVYIIANGLHYEEISNQLQTTGTEKANILIVRRI